MTMTASPTPPPSLTDRLREQPFEIILEEDILPRGTFDLRAMRPVPTDAPMRDRGSSALVRQSWHQGVGSLLRFLAGAAAIVGLLLLAVHVYSQRAHQVASPAHRAGPEQAGAAFEPILILEAESTPTEPIALRSLPSSLEDGEPTAHALGNLESDVEAASVESPHPDAASAASQFELALSAVEVLPVSSDPKTSEVPAVSRAVRFARALAQERSGDVEHARAEYARLLAEDFDQVGPHYRLGLLDQRDGALESAAVHYRAALEADPVHAPSWNNLSVVEWRRGRLAEARTAVARALEIEPELGDAWCNRGWMALEMGARSAARRDLEHSLSLDPDLPEARFNLALLEIQEGRAAQAESQAAALTALARPEWESSVRELRGRIAEHRSKLDQARVHYEAALELDPGSTRMLAALIDLHLARGDVESAWPRSRELLSSAPDDPRSHRRQARVLMALEDWEKARASWERTIELEPGSADDLYHLAWSSERAGVMPEALRRYEEVLEVDESHVPTLINLSRFYLQAERPDAALVYLSRAESADPESLLVLINKGIAFRDLGRRSEARAVLAAAVDRQRTTGRADPGLERLVATLTDVRDSDQ